MSWTQLSKESLLLQQQGKVQKCLLLKSGGAGCRHCQPLFDKIPPKSVGASTHACTSISRTKAPSPAALEISTLLLLLLPPTPSLRDVSFVSFPLTSPFELTQSRLGTTRSAAAVCSRDNLRLLLRGPPSRNPDRLCALSRP